MAYVAKNKSRWQLYSMSDSEAKILRNIVQVAVASLRNDSVDKYWHNYVSIGYDCTEEEITALKQLDKVLNYIE